MHWHKTPPKKEYNPKKRLGYVHVYTGEGKGKTSVALGTALRASGHGLKVLVIQFIKGHKDYGELLASERLGPNVEFVQFGTPDVTRLDDPSAMDIYLAQQALDFARNEMVHNRPDILILDEINPAARYGLVKVSDVLDFLDNKHRETEVILTGREAPPEFLNAADLVTVMVQSKSPYREDDLPRRGIEH
jgi:cob(I)alamin adenosyltransferase